LVVHQAHAGSFHRSLHDFEIMENRRLKSFDLGGIFYDILNLYNTIQPNHKFISNRREANLGKPKKWMKQCNE
jgi:hypothetical protein